MRLMFVGSGAARRKYAGQKENSTYAWAGSDLPEPGDAVVLTDPGVITYGSDDDVPLGIVEHADTDGMVTVCRYGVTVSARVASAVAAAGVVTVAVDGAGKLKVVSDAPGRTAIIDTFADDDDNNRWAAVTLL